MRIMLIDENPERAATLKNALCTAGNEVVFESASALNMLKRVAETQPDMIIIETESPSRDTLEHLCEVSRDQPRPIVMFTHDGSSDTIRAAIQAGVSSYVVDGLDPDRIKPILDVAISRFEAHQDIKLQLDKANTSLADRKLIERAKGILMKQRKLSEEDAYQAMRKMSMEQGLKMSELAQQVISVSALLG